MWDLIQRLFTGEDAATREARLRTTADLKDPRKAFVSGVLAVSYDTDPAYQKAHATQAIREWYGVRDAEELRSFTPDSFGTRSHPAYNHYRLCFLARAGQGAGLLDEAESWSWALREAAAVQRAYSSWQDYANGYVEGHLEYRAQQGDSPAQLAQYRANLGQRFAAKQRQVWVAIPFDTPLGA